LAVVTPRLTLTTRVNNRSRESALPAEFSRYRERILQRGKTGVENPVEREYLDKHGRNSNKNVDLAKRIDDLFLLFSVRHCASNGETDGKARPICTP
jgi:hypothetical protein